MLLVCHSPRPALCLTYWHNVRQFILQTIACLNYTVDPINNTRSLVQIISLLWICEMKQLWPSFRMHVWITMALLEFEALWWSIKTWSRELQLGVYSASIPYTQRSRLHFLIIMETCIDHIWINVSACWSADIVTSTPAIDLEFFRLFYIRHISIIITSKWSRMIKR